MLFFPITKKLLKRKGRVPFHDSPPDLTDGAFREKRAPHATLTASMTIEASLVLPIFVMAIMTLVFFVQAIQINTRIQTALFNQTLKTAGYAFFLSDSDLATEAEQFMEAEFVKLSVINELGDDFFKNRYIVNGKDGFTLNLTNISDKGIIDVALQYKLQVPFDIFGVGRLNFVSRARCKTWSVDSKGIGDSDLKIVYVTPSGTVYHVSKECRHIKNSSTSCKFEELANKRNLSGGKYYPCNKCSMDSLPGKWANVYYTTYGTRYHLDPLCPNINTNIFAIEESVAKEKYRLCASCDNVGE